jgi:hypothetical protein
MLTYIYIRKKIHAYDMDLYECQGEPTGVCKILYTWFKNKKTCPLFITLIEQKDFYFKTFTE